VELVNRKLTGRHFHQYLNPGREVEEGAFEVHGISDEFLQDKPLFPQVVDDFLAFIDGAELVIHNAAFDLAFLNNELKLAKRSVVVEKMCTIVDSLMLARHKHPGQKNNLDALCKRYGIDNSQRDLHGALLDSEILADVYLMMTGGQTKLELSDLSASQGRGGSSDSDVAFTQRTIGRVIHASETELLAHAAKLEQVDTASGGQCLWKQSD